MATYVVLVNWTDQGAAGFEHTTERVDHEAEIRKRAGVQLKEIYWTQGPYDLVAIIEAPDDESIAARCSVLPHTETHAQPHCEPSTARSTSGFSRRSVE